MNYTKEKVKIILKRELFKESFILNRQRPYSSSVNRNIYKKYNEKYPNLFTKITELIYCFKNKNNLDIILNKMFCYCGKKKKFTTRFDMPYTKYCSSECCKKSKQYQDNRKNSWHKTWNSHTQQEKDKIHIKQQKNRKMTEDSINRMVKNKRNTVLSWTDEKRQKVSNKLSESIKNSWKKKTLGERIRMGNIISKSLHAIGNDGLTSIQHGKIKAKKTCIEKYGVDNPWKVREIQDKIKNKNLVKYNVDYYLKSDKFKNNHKQFMLNKYNAEYYSQTDRFKDLWKNKVFVEKFLQKQYNTKKKNKSFNSSSSEDECFKLLKIKFTDVIHSYKSNLYPFVCDFYIPSKDLYIECNFHWTHGKELFNKNNPLHLEQLEKWKTKNTKFYNNAIEVWTTRDVNKLECFKKNNLNYKIFYSENEFNDWFSKQ